MLKKLLSLAVIVLVIAGCKDDPPTVIQNPVLPPEPPEHLIDQYYHVQFTWGKRQDTLTLQVPDDTTELANFDYYDFVLDLRNELVYDTADPMNIEPPLDKIGWHYAPATVMMPNILVKLEQNGGGSLEEAQEATKNVFTIAFPFNVDDTLPFWDIQDYLDNPSLVVGPVKWGRVGNNVLKDTIWNNDVQSGAVISFVDDGGHLWESDNHPTFQPFGYFFIRKIFVNHRDFQSYNIIEGEFAARLYDDIGDFKDMRNGEFRLRILSDIELGDQPD